SPGDDVAALRQLEAILEVEPENLSAQLDRARLAAKTNDPTALREAVARLGTLADSWPDRAREEYRALQQAAAGTNPRLAGTRVLRLRNVLMPVAAFRRSIDALQTPVGMVGEPIERFLRLPSPTPTPSAPDEAISFVPEALTVPSSSRWDAI